MEGPVDYYKVLGVPRDASLKDIKTAYHAAAKKAHPDAGGSTAVMERVNEAYKVLSSPLLRREYDHVSAAPRPHSAQQPGYHPAHRAGPQAPQPKYERPQPPPGSHHKSLNRWGRIRGLTLIQRSLLLAIPGIIIARFLITHTSSLPARYIFSAAAFAPVYTLIVGLVWVIDPGVRISLERIRLGKGYRRLPDYLATLGLALAWIPVLFLWFIFTGVN